jgi:hypothetical protein
VTTLVQQQASKLTKKKKADPEPFSTEDAPTKKHTKKVAAKAEAQVSNSKNAKVKAPRVGGKSKMGDIDEKDNSDEIDASPFIAQKQKTTTRTSSRSQPSRRASSRATALIEKMSREEDAQSDIVAEDESASSNPEVAKDKPLGRPSKAKNPRSNAVSSDDSQNEEESVAASSDREAHVNAGSQRTRVEFTKARRRKLGSCSSDEDKDACKLRSSSKRIAEERDGFSSSTVQSTSSSLSSAVTIKVAQKRGPTKPKNISKANTANPKPERQNRNRQDRGRQDKSFFQRNSGGFCPRGEVTSTVDTDDMETQAQITQLCAMYQSQIVQKRKRKSEAFANDATGILSPSILVFATHCADVVICSPFCDGVVSLTIVLLYMLLFKKNSN